MDFTVAALIGLGILALLLIAFFAVFRGKGRFKVKTQFGEATAEGENPPVTSVPAGVRIRDADAGKNVHAHSGTSGGVDIEKVKAAGEIQATHSQPDSPPKA